MSQPAPPRFVDADLEQGLIGALLLAPQRLDETSIVTLDDFYYEAHQHAWRVVEDTPGADQLVAAAELHRRWPSVYDAATARILAFSFTSSCICAAHAARYAAALHALGCRRRVDDACHAWLADPDAASAQLIKAAIAGLQHLRDAAEAA